MVTRRKKSPRGATIATRKAKVRVMSLLSPPAPRPALSPALRAMLQAKLGPGNYSSLARKTGYDPTHVTDVLSGRAKCSFEFACLVCDITSTSLDNLRDYMESCRRTPPKYRRGGVDAPALRRALAGGEMEL